jgi:hypothetical protein
MISLHFPFFLIKNESEDDSNPESGTDKADGLRTHDIDGTNLNNTHLIANRPYTLTDMNVQQFNSKQIGLGLVEKEGNGKLLFDLRKNCCLSGSLGSSWSNPI